MSLEDWIPDRERGEGLMFGLNRHTTEGIFDSRGERLRRSFLRRLVNAIGAAWAVFRGAMRE